MKRDGWSVKRLGEVCEIFNGRNQKKVEDINGKYPIYGSGGIMGYANDYICRAGTTIIGRKGSINKPLYVDKDFWNVDTAFGLQPKDCCHSRFLYYLCRSIDFTRYDKGVTIPSLVKSDLLQIPVSLPPLPEQSLIVEELDRLSSILEKKRQQLSDLDNLAQSIFYEMFGDPVRNEKGWEVKPLKENVYEMFLGPFGSALKVDSYVDRVDAYCMVYEQKHAIQGSLDVTTHYISKEKYESLKRFEVRAGDFIMSCRGTIGKLYQLPLNAPMGIIHPSLMKIRVKEDAYHSMYFKFMLVKVVANESTNGNCVQMAITAKELGNRELSLPPLPLQHLFAQKVEAIEQEKALIKQSIKEVQELLDSRMEEYFGGVEEKTSFIR
ncbi:MAG: restriction endonuclease subunit S [Bacteroides sp.]|nr:restriction endonuclease subunit S [Bacteroides sp.]